MSDDQYFKIGHLPPLPKDEFKLLGFAVSLFVTLIGLFIFVLDLKFPNFTITITQNVSNLVEEIAKTHRYSLFTVIGLEIFTLLITFAFIVYFRGKNAIKLSDFDNSAKAILSTSFDSLKQIEEASTKILRQAEAHALHLGGMVHPFLITWKQSTIYEESAEFVYCFTPDLLWPAKHKKEIVESIRRFPSKKYFYIVVDNKTKAITQNEASIRREIEKTSCGDSLFIKYLTDHPVVARALIRLPFWVDIVLYCNICVRNGNDVIEKRDRVGVMSTTPLRNLENADYTKQYDVALTDDICEMVEADFKILWGEIPDKPESKIR